MSQSETSAFLHQVHEFYNLNTFGDEDEHEIQQSEVPQSSFSVKADLLLQIHALNAKTLTTLKLMIKPQPALQNLCTALVGLLDPDPHLDRYALSSPANWAKVQSLVGNPKLIQERLTSFVYCPILSKFDGIFEQCCQRIPQIPADFKHSIEQGSLFENLRSLVLLFDRYREILLIELNQKQDSQSYPNQVFEEKDSTILNEVPEKKRRSQSQVNLEIKVQPPVVPPIDCTHKKSKAHIDTDKGTPANERSRLSTNRSQRVNPDAVPQTPQQQRTIAKTFLERPNHTGYYDNPTLVGKNKPFDVMKTSKTECSEPKLSERSEGHRTIDREISVKLLQFLQDTDTVAEMSSRKEEPRPKLELPQQTKTNSLTVSLTPGNMQSKMSPQPSRLSYHARQKDEDPYQLELKERLKQNQKEILEIQWQENRLKWEIERESKQLLQLQETKRERERHLESQMSESQIHQAKLKEIEEKRERSQENQLFRKNYKIIATTDALDYIQHKDQLLHESIMPIKHTPKQALRMYTEPSESQSNIQGQNEDPCIQRLKEKVVETQRVKEQLQNDLQRSLKSVNRYARTTPFKWVALDHKFVFKKY